MFKIGDVVMLSRPDKWHNEGNMDRFIGKEGIVTGVMEGGTDTISVKFDGITFSFDGTGLVKVKKMKDAVRKPKFQIGDRVKVVKAKVKDQYGGYDPHMKLYEDVGEIFTISEVIDGKQYYSKRIGYKFKGDGAYTWDEECLRRVRKVPVAALKAIKPLAPQEAAIIAPVPVVEAPRVIRTEFGVGDVVVCIEPGPKLEMGREYIISHIEQGFVGVQGEANNFYPHRFKHSVVYYEEQQIAAVVAPIIPVKKKVPTLQEELRKKVGDNAGVCSYAIEFSDGDTMFHVRDICHARVLSRRGGDIVKLALDIKGHSVSMEKKRASYHQYVNYIMNESPWATTFHRKGVDHALKHGILVNVEAPKYRCLGAAIALREGSEHNEKLALFSLLLDKGYSGNTAYLLSAAVRYGDNKFHFSGLNNSHRVLMGGQDAELLFKFFREGYTHKKADEPYRTDHFNDDGVYKYIANRSPDYAKQIDTIMRAGFKVEKPKGWDSSSLVTDENFFAYADSLDTILNS